MNEKKGFRAVGKDIKVKNKFTRFLLNNTDQSIVVDRIVCFCYKYKIILCKDLDHYESGEKSSIKRVMVLCLFKMATFLTALRFFVSAVANNRFVTIWMSDANYLLADQRMFSTLVCMACVCLLSIGMVLQIQEMSETSTLFTFLNAFKYKRVIQLNEMNTRRLVVRMNLMAKYVMNQSFWPLVISTTAMFTFASVVAYLDPNSGFVLISTIFWGFVLFIYIQQLFALTSVGMVVCALSTLYLKYKFREIYQKIESSIKSRNRLLLLKAITEHNSIAVQTKALNSFFGAIIFILYFMATPPIMLLMYLTHAKDTSYYTRYIIAFIFIIIFGVMFTINLLSSLVNRWAHRPYPLLYTYVIRNKIRTQQLLKILAFMETLSGPDIGFYCWDLFPMNNYQFYQYVANCGATYFLILEIIMKY